MLRKPAFCICKKIHTDQLHCHPTTDQHFKFHYIDSRIPLLPKSEISSLLPSSVAVQPGLCGTWSKTQKIGFLRHFSSITLTGVAVFLLSACPFVDFTSRLLFFQSCFPVTEKIFEIQVTSYSCGVCTRIYVPKIAPEASFFCLDHPTRLQQLKMILLFR